MDSAVKIIAEALGHHWCKQRDINPEGWCSYYPSANGHPARCIETYLEWQVKVNMDKARAVHALLDERNMLRTERGNLDACR